MNKYKGFAISKYNYEVLRKVSKKYGTSIMNLANGLLSCYQDGDCFIEHETYSGNVCSIKLTIKAAEKLNKIKSKYKCTVNDVFSGLLDEFIQRLNYEDESGVFLRL